MITRSTNSMLPPTTHPLVQVVEGVVQEADRLLAALVSLCNRDNTDITIQCDDDLIRQPRINNS